MTRTARPRKTASLSSEIVELDRYLGAIRSAFEARSGIRLYNAHAWSASQDGWLKEAFASASHGAWKGYQAMQETRPALRALLIEDMDNALRLANSLSSGYRSS